METNLGRSPSQKAQRRQEKKLEKLAKLRAVNQLPDIVAEQDPQLPEFLDGNNYQLIFSEYNHNQCELRLLDKKSAKKLIEKLSEITRYNKNSIAGSNIIRDDINNSGVYKPLFSGLQEDIEMKEIEFANNGRIFCYLVNNYSHGDSRSNNYCCIIAVKTNHMETH